MSNVSVICVNRNENISSTNYEPVID